jgi:hypothetical protein
MLDPTLAALGILVVLPALTSASTLLTKAIVDRWAGRDQERENSYIAYKNAQIAELYAPLSQMLSRRRVLETMYKKFVSGGLDDAKNIVERGYCDPLELEIATLIEQKSHLFCDGQVPATCKQFLEYARAGVCAGYIYERTGLNCEMLVKVDYPEDLDAQITQTLEKLSQEYVDYLTTPSSFLGKLATKKKEALIRLGQIPNSTNLNSLADQPSQIPQRMVERDAFPRV